MRTLMKPVLAGVALAAMLGSAPLPAGANDCATQWNASPASSYCTGVTLATVTESDAAINGTAPGNCHVSGGSDSCAITVQVGGIDTYYTPSLGEHYLSPDDVDSFDICFRLSTGWWEVSVKAGCSTDETTSSTATTNGLGEPAANAQGG